MVLLCIVKNIIAILIFTCLFVSGLLANNDPRTNKMLSGNITDKQTGETLAGVKIEVKGTNTFCYTDMNGNFALSVNTNNVNEVLVNMIGYEPLSLKINQLTFGSIFVLSPR